MPVSNTTKSEPDSNPEAGLREPFIQQGISVYGTGPEIQLAQPHPSFSNSLKSIKLRALIPVTVCVLAYVCMNREGSKEINSNAVRWLTAADSGSINGGLYYLVFGELRNTPKKFQTFLKRYTGITSPVAALMIATTLAPVFILAAIPMLETTVAGADLLGFPDRLGTSLGWAMTLARAIAVFQGFIELPDTWDYIKNKYDQAEGRSKTAIGFLGAASLIGSVVYVLTMRSSVLTGLGNVDAINKNFACWFQKTHTAAHLTAQWAATLVNYPFYALWITRGMIRTFEPFWDKKQRNQIPLRILAMVMAVFSLAPSAAPLFSGLASTKVAPVIEDGCQLTGSWIAPLTQFAFERTKAYQYPISAPIMGLAFFMNVSSLLKNFGVYRDKQDMARVIGDPLVPADHQPQTSGLSDSGQSMGAVTTFLQSSAQVPSYPGRQSPSAPPLEENL